MDETTQSSGILPERYRALELRLEITAALAASVAYQQLRWQQTLAALETLRCSYGFDGIQALLAYGKTGDVYEGDTTEPAIGGEEDRKNAAGYSHHWRDEGWKLLGALRSSLSV